MISFFSPGEVVALGRPRVTFRGGRAQAYTPKKSSDYKRFVADYCRILHGKHKHITGAIIVRICVCIEPPKSWSKTKRAKALSGEISPISRPDLDNYVKGLLDALNGIFWHDDSQVTRLDAEKRYGTEPGAYVVIQEFHSPVQPEKPEPQN